MVLHVLLKLMRGGGEGVVSRVSSFCVAIVVVDVVVVLKLIDERMCERSV